MNAKVANPLLREALQRFGELLELEPEARAEALSALRHEHSALGARVAELLDAHVRADASAFMTADGPGGATGGERVGAYVLQRPLGRGGMGEVWLAARADGRFEGLVAVKFLHAALTHPALAARFEREGAILGRLRHPGIAALLDAGVSAHGRGYLILEYVDGQAIDAYCDARRLGIESRLRLFLDVCGAVSAAHARLVVHRDIKPGNILVTADARTKLLDFGIAKLLSADGPETTGEGTELTRLGGRVLTPEYAAPEQIRGEPVTTATDVYALGVLLFKLLSGRLPFATDGLSPAEREHLALSGEPASLLAVSRRDAGAGELARLRDLRPQALRKRLRGDLDVIVSRCLRKSPEARYASVEALSEDLRRHLAHLPIAARPDALTYRSAKFLRRHGSTFGIAAAALLVLVLGAIFVTLRLAAARDTARAEAARAEQASDFLVELFRVSDPAFNRGDRLSASEILERGTQRLDAELSDQPALQVSLAGLIGEIHTKLGEYDKAERLLEFGLGTNAGLGDPDTQAKLLSQRAWLEHLRGNYGAALEWLDRAAVVAADGTDTELVAYLYNKRALAQTNLGDYAAAERSYRESLQRLEAVKDDDAVELGPPLNNLAFLLWKSLHRPDEARRLFERALALYRRHYGDVHPYTSGTYGNLGWLLSAEGDFDGAEPYLQRNLELSARLHGEHSFQYGHALVTVGNFESDRGRPAAGIERYRQAYAVYRESLGPDHNYLAYPLFNLGLRYREAGELATALQQFDEALAVLRRSLPGNHPRVASAQHERGEILAVLGRREDARAALNEALEIRVARLPADSPERLETELEWLLVQPPDAAREALAPIAGRLLAAWPQDDPGRPEMIARLQSADLLTPQDPSSQPSRR